MRFHPLLALPALANLTLGSLEAQILGPSFAADYSFTSLGTPNAVLAPLGGINFKPGDTNTLLLGGSANNTGGQIYEVPVTRDSSGHIVSFAGPGVATISAPNIDGGLAFSNDGVMFVTTFSNHRLPQYLPGSTTPDRDISLATFGLAGSVGTCQFVPSGFPGAGQFKIASYNGDDWYDVVLNLAANGTYDITSATQTATGINGPEGIVYVLGGNAGFTSDSVLICEYSAGTVGAYEIDANGDPIVSTRREFMTSLNGAEGAVIDPVTGDFLFSTFGGTNQVLVISGFDLPSVFAPGRSTHRAACPP